MSHLYETIAQELAILMDKGVYRAGDRLPGVREIALKRGISIATVLAAYRRLEDAGYLQARARSGFYVRTRRSREIAPPHQSTLGAKPSLVQGQELVLRLVQAANDPHIVQLGAAVPDPSFMPGRAIQQALMAASRGHYARAINYAFSPGIDELRREIALRMAESGCSVSPDEIVITTGCQEALTLALRAVAERGDVVAIESPTFYGLLQVIDSLGLKALEIPSDPQQGMSLDALQLAIETWPVKACVTIPNYSNPLGYCMSDERKQRLVKLLAGRDIALIEDDVYGDLGFDGRRPSTCKAFSPDVIHCGSFSKTLAPGLRIGWIAAGPLREKTEYLKFVTNLGSTTVAQFAIADLLHSGKYERHLRRVRQDFRIAVDRMREAVGRLFPEETRITQPAGGFVIWVELPPTVDTVALAASALTQGVSIAPGPIFSPTQRYHNFMRLSCAYPWDGRLERAVSILARMLPAADRAHYRQEKSCAVNSACRPFG